MTEAQHVAFSGIPSEVIQGYFCLRNCQLDLKPARGRLRFEYRADFFWQGGTSMTEPRSRRFHCATIGFPLTLLPLWRSKPEPIINAGNGLTETVLKKMRRAHVAIGPFPG